MSVAVRSFPSVLTLRPRTRSFGILSTYPPTPCGLATFTAALASGLEANGADVGVVRVADEIVVDLMKAACGIAYKEASRHVDLVEVDGVPIPFANPELLLRMKDTYRDKDKLDRAFLARLVDQRKKR